MPAETSHASPGSWWCKQPWWVAEWKMNKTSMTFLVTPVCDCTAVKMLRASSGSTVWPCVLTSKCSTSWLTTEPDTFNVIRTCKTELVRPEHQVTLRQIAKSLSKSSGPALQRLDYDSHSSDLPGELAPLVHSTQQFLLLCSITETRDRRGFLTDKLVM